MFGPIVRSGLRVATFDSVPPRQPQYHVGRLTVWFANAAIAYWCATKLPSRFDWKVSSARTYCFAIAQYWYTCDSGT